MAKNLVEEVAKGEHTVLSELKGSDLVGKTYQPPFSYIQAERSNVIVGASFVTDASGTGIVHMAPAHGEDDYKTCRENGISFVNVVDTSGKYTDTVTDFAGRFVKTATLISSRYCRRRACCTARRNTSTAIRSAGAAIHRCYTTQRTAGSSTQRPSRIN